MLDTATDYLVVKRFSTFELDAISVSSAPYDHLRILVYRLSNNGAETLVFTSDPFTIGTAPQEFLLTDVNDVGNDEIGVVNSEFYRVDVFEYDAGETVNQKVTEYFLFVWPDIFLTQGTVQHCGAIDMTLYSQLLAHLGHNVLHGEFLNAGGYTQQRVLRAFGVDLTESEAQALLLTSAAPSDVDVTYKSRAVVTTADNGNELASREAAEAV